MRVRHGMEPIGGAADAIVEPARADRDAADDANARRERPSLLKVDDRLWDQAGMDPQIPATLEGAQRRGRYLAQPRLDRRTVRNEAGNSLADRLRDCVVRTVRAAEKLLLGFDIGGQRLEGDRARTRHGR